MSDRSQKAAFGIFHYALASVVFILSIQTVLRSLKEPSSLHVTLLVCFAGLEALSALLFVIPKTLKLSGYILIAIFLFAFIFHALHGETNLSLLVYAAGTLLVLSKS
jgi:hypothetical protein